MKLHNNKEVFYKLILIVSDYYKIDSAQIEKDYFVTLLLKDLVLRMPNLLFKGGTSLSKCYKIINRFSEDIDLTLEEDCHTQSHKKQMKSKILESCEELQLKLINIEDIRSRRDYNCYRIEYPIYYSSTSINPLLLVETTYITKSYPSEIKEVTSIIYNYFKEIGNEEAIAKYELEPFDIKVQSLSRTLVDKVFAICDYMIDGKTERLSRHIYDISQLLKKVKLDDELKDLIRKVREERKSGTKCYSAQDDKSVPELLKQIVNTNYYQRDYKKITEKLLSKIVTYEEAIKGIETIIDSGVFE